METQGVLIHFVFQTKTRSFQDWSTILEEHTRVKPAAAAPSHEGGGRGLFVLVDTPLLFKKAL